MFFVAWFSTLDVCFCCALLEDCLTLGTGRTARFTTWHTVVFWEGYPWLAKLANASRCFGNTRPAWGGRRLALITRLTIFTTDCSITIHHCVLVFATILFGLKGNKKAKSNTWNHFQEIQLVGYSLSGVEWNSAGTAELRQMATRASQFETGISGSNKRMMATTARMSSGSNLQFLESFSDYSESLRLQNWCFLTILEWDWHQWFRDMNKEIKSS